MPDTSVKVFSSYMSGAPALSSSAGALITVLDACLVNGFGQVTLDSLVVSNNVATATKSAGHGFAMVGSSGPVVTIAGATPSGLNGQWRVTVTGTTTFTFATSEISNQTATGTITAKRSPLGFSKTFSGTNKAVYRADAAGSTRLFLRIDNTYGDSQHAMYENMTDVDTGTGYGGVIGTRNNGPWRIFGDDRCFYLFNNEWGANWCGCFFGDIVSYRSGDQFHCALIGGATTSAQASNLHLVNGDTNTSFLARAGTQVGAAVTAARYSHRKLDIVGNAACADINTSTNGRTFWPVEIWESTTFPRGLLPGFYCPLSTQADGTLSLNVDSLNGATLLSQAIRDQSYRCGMVIDRAWR